MFLELQVKQGREKSLTSAKHKSKLKPDQAMAHPAGPMQNQNH